MKYSRKVVTGVLVVLEIAFCVYLYGYLQKYKVAETYLAPLEELSSFFAELQQSGLNIDKVSSEDLAKKLEVKTPELLVGSTLNKVEKEDSSKYSHTFSTLVPVLQETLASKDTLVAEMTKTKCYMSCGDVPFVGFRCIMVCATCTDEWGGGCRITVYY